MSDIEARLREAAEPIGRYDEDGLWVNGGDLLREAADTIATLRSQLAAARRVVEAARDLSEHGQTGIGHYDTPRERALEAALDALDSGANVPDDRTPSSGEKE